MSQKAYALRLTLPEIDHIYNLLIHNGDADDGHYYGNRGQYEARGQRILKKIQDAIGINAAGDGGEGKAEK